MQAPNTSLFGIFRKKCLSSYWLPVGGSIGAVSITELYLLWYWIYFRKQNYFVSCLDAIAPLPQPVLTWSCARLKTIHDKDENHDFFILIYSFKMTATSRWSQWVNSLKPDETLTHWGRVTHICISKLTIIGSDNGLSPGRRQAIIWTNAGIMLIGPLRTNFSEILIEIFTFSFKKMHLKMSSGNGGHLVSASMC